MTNCLAEPVKTIPVPYPAVGIPARWVGKGEVIGKFMSLKSEGFESEHFSLKWFGSLLETEGKSAQWGVNSSQ